MLSRAALTAVQTRVDEELASKKRLTNSGYSADSRFNSRNIQKKEIEEANQVNFLYPLPA
jgi:hypothetical protein